MAALFTRSGVKILINEEDFPLLCTYKWRIINKNYACTNIDGKTMYIHRLLMKVSDPKIFVDHKDHNGLNNQRSNLRIATASDNSKNRLPWGASKFIGVSKHSKGWTSKITIDGKGIFLGIFKKESDAAIAYNNAAIKTGNEFYYLNNIKGAHLFSVKHKSSKLNLTNKAAEDRKTVLRKNLAIINKIVWKREKRLAQKLFCKNTIDLYLDGYIANIETAETLLTFFKDKIGKRITYFRDYNVNYLMFNRLK